MCMCVGVCACVRVLQVCKKKKEEEEKQVVGRKRERKREGHILVAGRGRCCVVFFCFPRCCPTSAKKKDYAAAPALEDRMMPTISPYSASASAKIRMRIIPTNSLGCCALARTPASPTMPIAMPAARPARPQDRPDDRWAKPSKSVYLTGETAQVGLV